jgi:hypothetical protein
LTLPTSLSLRTVRAYYGRKVAGYDRRGIDILFWGKMYFFLSTEVDSSKNVGKCENIFTYEIVNRRKNWGAGGELCITLTGLGHRCVLVVIGGR